MPPKAKGAKAKRCKGKNNDAQSWLEARVASLTLDLHGRGVFVPPPEQEPSSIIERHADKGSTEKRRLTGNTKATQKAMRSMHLQVLEKRVLQLERLLGEASSVPAPADEFEAVSHGEGSNGTRGGGVIFGMEVPAGPWKGEGSGGGVCDSSGSSDDAARPPT